MAKKKSNQQVSKDYQVAMEAFRRLSEREKVLFLTRNRIWFVRHRGQIVAPMLELESVLNRLGRLSWLCRRFYDLDQARMLKFNLELIKAISEEAIRENVVEPINKIFDDYNERLGQLFAESKKERATKKGEAQEEDSQEEDKKEEAKQE